MNEQNTNNIPVNNVNNGGSTPPTPNNGISNGVSSTTPVNPSNVNTGQVYPNTSNGNGTNNGVSNTQVYPSNATYSQNGVNTGNPPQAATNNVVNQGVSNQGVNNTPNMGTTQVNSTAVNSSPNLMGTQVSMPPQQDLNAIGAKNPLGGTNVITGMGFVPTGEEIKPKKNKKLGFIIGGLVIVVVGLLGYFVIYPLIVKTYFSDPKNVYDTTIDNFSKNIYNVIEDAVHDKSIYDIKFSFESNVNNLQDYSGYTYGLNIGVDSTSKLVQSGLAITDLDNVEHSYYKYLKNGKEYVRYSSYRDLIYVGDADLESQDEIFTSFNNLFTQSDKISTEDFKYLTEKVTTLVKGSIDESKLIKEDDSITVNGNVLKVTANKYTIDNELLKSTIKYILDGIANDDKALEIVSELVEKDSSEVKSYLLGNEITSKLDDEEYKNFNVTIDVYTYGTKNEIVGYNISDKDNESVHIYSYKDYFELKAMGKVTDSDTGKINEATLLIVGVKDGSKKIYSCKYNDEEIANVTVNKWDDKDIDIDFVYIDEVSGNTTGNFKLNKDITSDRAKFNLGLDIKIGSEYVNADLAITEDWTSDIANINTKNAVTLTDTEIEEKQSEFIESLYDTPIGLLFKTVSGGTDPELNKYYGIDDSLNYDNDYDTDNNTDIGDDNDSSQDVTNTGEDTTEEIENN